MRAARPCSFSLLWMVLGFASSASSVTIDFVPIGNPGNACDPQAAGCFGTVSYDYAISRYEVTNSQYAEFLNAKAASDPLGLYSSLMALNPGGITRSGVSGSFTYSVITGRADIPVIGVSIYDAMRFSNWLSNGQGTGDTETGSYLLLGGTATPSNPSVTRDPFTATIVIPTEDEWYKAAYYDAGSSSYFDYPAGTDAATGCSAPTATANRANCGGVISNLSIRGSYTNSASPYGTFDQGGNAYEWVEEVIGSNRVIRGGSYNLPANRLAADARFQTLQAGESSSRGFRVGQVVPIPEPGAALLLLGGLIGLARRRRSH